jgi:uncharacterized surface protein with fasciclin (FAS1) repeats
MNRFKKVLPVLVALVLLARSAAPALAGPPPWAGPPPEETIVDVAIANGGFSILVSTLQATGLDSTLDGRGQFMVFAPPDTAFEAAAADLDITPAELWDFLVKNPDVLTDILLYHVAPGRRNSNAVLGSEQINTLYGAFLYQDGGVLTDQLGREVEITATNIMASNGVIHVINNVVLPYNPLAQ